MSTHEQTKICGGHVPELKPEYVIVTSTNYKMRGYEKMTRLATKIRKYERGKYMTEPEHQQKGSPT